MEKYFKLSAFVLLLGIVSAKKSEACGETIGNKTVRAVWFDARTSAATPKLAVQFNEDYPLVYGYAYNSGDPASVFKSNALYSTLLTAFSTGSKVTILLNAASCGTAANGFWFDYALLGTP
jgi:hypothetical protein